MQKFLLVFLLILFALISGCSQEDRAKRLGETITVELPVDQKLIEVDWSGNNAWYLTRPMSESDSAVTYTYQEKSSKGIFQGALIIKEKRSPKINKSDWVPKPKNKEVPAPNNEKNTNR